MDGGGRGGVYNPRTVEEVYRDYQGRRNGLIKALTTDVERFYRQCDPEKENLCLYGFPSEQWEVNLPAEEVPPELPEPALGINFARDGMPENDWLSLVAVHSDAWLLSVAYYFGARFGFDKSDRKRLFNMINDLPTVFEVVAVYAKKQTTEKSSISNHSSNKSKSNTKGRGSESQMKYAKMQGKFHSLYHPLPTMAPPRRSSNFMSIYGYDVLLGSIAAFYVLMAPFTKVEESFNVQAMHDILYHWHHIENYDHLEFPGVVPRTFIGALLVSILASPVVLAINLLHLPKIYSLLAVRLALGFFILATLRFLRVQIRNKFGLQVEAFFVILLAIQFHMLFYCTRPLPNILALGLVNLSYGYWFKGSFYATLRCLIFATIVFRCDMLLLLCPLGLELLLTKSISLWKAIKCCAGAAIFSIGLTIFIDSIMWQRWLWPEFEVFWFNSVLNRSSEWGVS